MYEQARCPECHSLLPSDAPEGLCPQCLMKLAMDEGTCGDSISTVINSNSESSSLSPENKDDASFDPDDVQKQFPQLEILGFLGRGGMGVVYKARQKNLDRLVALKLLAPEWGHKPAFAERFNREAKALAKLNHPHIVTVYDFGITEAGQYFFIMEYVDGPNLRALIQSGHLGPEQALALIPQICEALQFAHDEGVVHRDIKPANILMDTKGRVKIADFGLAKLMNRDPDDLSLTSDGQTMGTQHYMAPEQMEKPKTVDHRADIYSVGVVFYEMLTGELPLGRFRPPSERVEVDVRLDEIVLRTLAREPERRYQHVSEVKSDVEVISSSHHGKPAPHQPIPRQEQTEQIKWPLKKKRWLALTVVIVGVALLSLGGWLIEAKISSSRGRDAATSDKENIAVPAGAETSPVAENTKFPETLVLNNVQKDLFRALDRPASVAFSRLRGEVPDWAPNKSLMKTDFLNPLFDQFAERSEGAVDNFVKGRNAYLKPYNLKIENPNNNSLLTAIRYFSCPEAVRPTEAFTVAVGIENRDFGYRYNNTIYHVHLFGDWEPKKELSRLVDEGFTSDDNGSRDFRVRVRAPSEPGFYRLRLISIDLNTQVPESFQGSGPGAYSDIGFFVLDDSALAQWKQEFGEIQPEIVPQDSAVPKNDSKESTAACPEKSEPILPVPVASEVRKTLLRALDRDNSVAFSRLRDEVPKWTPYAAPFKTKFIEPFFVHFAERIGSGVVDFFNDKTYGNQAVFLKPYGLGVDNSINYPLLRCAVQWFLCPEVVHPSEDFEISIGIENSDFGNNYFNPCTYTINFVW